MSTLEVNSLQHLDASANNIDLDSSGNVTVLNGKLGVGTSNPSDNVEISTSADAQGLLIKNSGNNRTYLTFDSNRTGAGNNLAQMNFRWDGTDVVRIIAVAGADTTNKDDAHVTFCTASAGSVDERLRITSAGNVGIGTSSPDNTTYFGRVVHVAGQSNAGIMFERTANAAKWSVGTHSSGDMVVVNGGTEKARFSSSGGITFNGDTAAANALDDYEEGSWTPVISASVGTINTYVISSANYTKIGRLCTINLYYYVTSNGTGSGYSKFTLPFTSTSLSGYKATGGGVEIGHTGHGIMGVIHANTTFGRVTFSKDGTYPTNGGYNQITISYITA
jgi:hypothetical protein